MLANQEFFTPKCKLCGSHHVVKYGLKNNIQRWWCKDCKHKFVDNNALSGMKTPIEQVASAISMYYEGMSLNAIRRQFAQMHNYLPSDSTVYEWIDKFRKKAVAEANKQTPKVGERWIADETVLKIGGQKYWLIDILDEKTRFFIYSHISKNRSIRDIKYAFEQAYELTKTYPKKVITDGWAGYPDGIEQAYGAYTKHELGSPFIATEGNTNLVERVQGTLKDRTKVLRGLKTKETANEYLKGWLVHYNYFRNHESLNDRTPASAAGVKLPYENWLGVVKGQQKTIKPIIPPDYKLPRIRTYTPRTKKLTMRPPKPSRGGLFMNKQGAMSRHYFRGARRVK